MCWVSINELKLLSRKFIRFLLSKIVFDSRIIQACEKYKNELVLSSGN
jgi:hypothetical protein